MKFNKFNFLAFCLVVHVASTGLVFSSERDRELAGRGSQDLDRRQARSRAVQMESQFQLDDIIDPKVLASKVREEFSAHVNLLHQSRERQIVAFVGNTGAGKSTLINFLANKNMERNGKNVVLKDPNDPDAMPIGLGGYSETLYPKSISAGDLLLYDLPGFNDTNGSIRNLINAAFIRQILTEAASVRLVIVSGEDEITASRGETFKKMLDAVQKLFKINPASAYNTFRDSSVLVITKSRCSNPAECADHVMEKSTDEYQGLLKIWTDNERFCHMCHVEKEADWDFERRTILSLISNSITGYFRESESSRDTVDISAIYPANTTRILEKMFRVIMNENIDNYLERLSKISELSEAIVDLGYSISENPPKSISNQERFWRKIDEGVSKIEEVRLLRPFCEMPYATALRGIERANSSKIQQFVKGLSDKIDRRKKEVIVCCNKVITAAIEQYHVEHNADETSCTSSLNPKFHRYVYDSICSEAILDQITGRDRKEKEVVYDHWKKFMKEYGERQVRTFETLYKNANDQATGGLWVS